MSLTSSISMYSFALTELLKNARHSSICRPTTIQRRKIQLISHLLDQFVHGSLHTKTFTQLLLQYGQSSICLARLVRVPVLTESARCCRIDINKTLVLLHASE